ncbi:novel immune-type receptor 8 isoform X3 [Pimephales promelas]|uniref:novel immune-type receptor 8 isoform X3 n=1 Tax=Pimephales promelas TaxID=90988 RepID=UPI0019559D69|nr:novel immune-type receptor 8 isoform X3 [Pimephales promelas]
MSTILFFTFVCCIGAQNIEQPKRLQTSKLGDDVTIECYLPNTDFNNMVWYKQGMGMKLQAILKTYIYMTDVEFFDGNTDGRFNVTIKKGIYHLHISLTKKEDIGTYFCGVVTLGELYFGPGTFLMLREEHTTTMVLQEPTSDKAHIGNNITLVCRVRMVDEKCAGGHHAYWFREAADESHPAIIYADEEMKKQHEEGCEGDSTTQICIYTLAMRNLSLSDAGTYYCAAVLACGKIVFGNGTDLELIPDNESTATPLFVILVSSNIISMIIMILLVAVRCEDQGRSSGDLVVKRHLKELSRLQMQTP